jgi:hypothetical protein
VKSRSLYESLDRLEQVAELVARTPCYKELSKETGYSRNYLANVMSKLVRLKRAGIVVPRETLITSLYSDHAFESLIKDAVAKLNVNISTEGSDR